MARQSENLGQSSEDDEDEIREDANRTDDNDSIIEVSSTSIRYFNVLFGVLFGLIIWICKSLFNGNKSKKAKSKEKRPSLINLITPWKLELDNRNKMIHFKKRNWFLIGVDTHSYKYVSVRNVLVNEYILTADISIKVYSGSISAYYFTKGDANYFKKALLNEIESS